MAAAVVVTTDALARAVEALVAKLVPVAAAAVIEATLVVTAAVLEAVEDAEGGAVVGKWQLP